MVARAGAPAGVAAAALPFLLSGVPYFEDYLLVLRFVALPLMVGGALGGLTATLLVPDLRAAGRGQPEAAEAPVAAPPAHRWLAHVALRVGAFLGGVLYALLVLFCAYLTSPSLLAGELSDTAYLLLPLLALAVPAALLALAASPAGARCGRCCWRSPSAWRWVCLRCWCSCRRRSGAC
jgi:hypothetical protein